PTIDSGFLRTLLSGSPTIRAGFSMAYTRNGMSDFSDTYGANPGILIDANRDQTLGNLGTVPLLFRDTARLAPPPIPTARPETDVITGDVQRFDPNLTLPYSQTWTAGIQRELGS